MKIALRCALLLVVVNAYGADSSAFETAKISTTLKRVADWQLANPNHTEIRNWVIAPLYDGLIDVSQVTGDPKYLAAVVRMGTQSGWEPGNLKYFADDHAVGHAWLDIYLDQFDFLFLLCRTQRDISHYCPDFYLCKNVFGLQRLHRKILCLGVVLDGE